MSKLSALTPEMVALRQDMLAAYKDSYFPFSYVSIAMELSPKQLHYFKRELLRIQLRQELETFRRHLDLPSLLQGTDIVIDGDTQHNLQHDDVPFIRYMFQHAVIEFPLLKSDRQQEFWNKSQDFLNELYKVRLNTYAPSHAETSQGRVLLYKLEKVLLLALNVGIKTKQGQEESIKVTPKDLDDDNANLHGENVASALEKGPQRKITVDVVTVVSMLFAIHDDAIPSSDT